LQRLPLQIQQCILGHLTNGEQYGADEAQLVVITFSAVRSRGMKLSINCFAVLACTIVKIVLLYRSGEPDSSIRVVGQVCERSGAVRELPHLDYIKPTTDFLCLPALDVTAMCTVFTPPKGKMWLVSVSD